MDNVQSFLGAALCATVYITPRDVGLTFAELIEISRRAGYREGEVQDVLRGIPIRMGQSKIRPQRHLGVAQMLGFSDFNMAYEPDYRKPDAFEFVRVELLELARDVGRANAKLDRDTLVARGVAKGFSDHDVDVAITSYILDEVFEEKDGAIRHANGRETWGRPSQQLPSRRREEALTLKHLATAFPLVKDVIERRTDGRVAGSEPLDAFEVTLSALGHSRFRTWWIQTRQELRRADVATQPTTVLFLAACLAEAALSFVVPLAQQHNLMKRQKLDEARTWRFKDLVGGAKSSDVSVDAILDERTGQRALDLNDARQRIHVGFLLEAIASGPIPDLKPEQAREALHTAEAVVRKVVEWVGRHPPTSPQKPS